MNNSIHPIAAIFNLCITEKTTIASKSALSSIKGNFLFDSDEIAMISIQLMNDLQISKIIPENRFTVKFDAPFLQQILNEGKSEKYVLLILLSSISWLIEVEKTQKINNQFFGLVLDLLDSISQHISIIYQITNFFYISIFKLNANIDFRIVEKQTYRFLDKYKSQPKFVLNTLLLWLQISYSFKDQTVFAKRMLSLTAKFYDKNQSLFSEEELTNLCFILNPKLSILDPVAIDFIIQIAHILPPNIIFESTTYLIDATLSALEFKGVCYKIFEKEQYSTEIELNYPPVSSYSLQFATEKVEYKYDNNFILPRFNFDPEFRISNQITSISNHIIKILSASSVKPVEFSSPFVTLLKNSLKSPHYFDVVAYLLSILLFCELDLSSLFKIIIDSPLFDPQLTIFTNESEKEPVHKLRMLTYKLIVFPIEENFISFIQNNLKYPLMIAELFYYAKRIKIPVEILKSDVFVHQIFISVLTFHCLKNKADQKLISSENCNNNDKNSNSNNSKNNVLKESNSTNKDNESDHNQNENENETEEFTDSLNQLEFQGDLWENTLFFEIAPPKPLCIPNEFGPESEQQHLSSSSEINDVSDQQVPNEGQLRRLVYSQSLHVFQENESGLENDNNNSSCISPIESSPIVSAEMFSEEGQKESDETVSKSLQALKIDANNGEKDESDNEALSDNLCCPSAQSGAMKEDIIHAPFTVQKVNHLVPLKEEENNFLKWLNEAKNQDCLARGKNGTDLQESMHCALIFIIVYISTIIEEDDIAAQWNESMEFIPALFSLIFDEYLRPIIISILKRIWSVQTTEVTSTSQGCILTIFQQIYDDEFALLDLQLLETINEQLTNHPHNKYDTFKPLCPMLTSVLANYDVSSSFLHNSMYFLAFFPKEIKSATRTAILAALHRTEGSEPNRQFFSDFILLITSTENRNGSTNFLITQPKMVSLFIEAFIESPILKEVILFIEALCQNSLANSYSCHKGKVDITILKYIGSHPHDDNLAALSLFSIIALRASSMPVVNYLISLFCPIKSIYLPPYISELTKTLTNIIIRRQCQPIAYFPLSRDSPSVKILRLTGNLINQGFTFVINLYIDQFAVKFQPRLITISDKKQVLTVGVFDSQITVYNSLNESVNFKNKIPSNTWVNVAVSFSPMKKTAECLISNQKKEVIEYNFVDFHFGTLFCEIGSGNTAAPTISQAAMVGSIGLYPFLENIPNFNSIENPIISIKFESEQSLLCINKTHPSDLEAVLNGHNVIQTLSLPDVLVRFFKAEILIPLFVQVDLTILGTEDQVQNAFAATIVNLLDSTLQLSIEAQQSFEQSQGFRIISIILTTISHSNLTFDLYLHFTHLFENISLPELKLQLFTFILTNAEIWSLSTSSTIQQIISHWDEVLFQRFRNYFLQVLPLHKLINSISHFYWRTNNSNDGENNSSMSDTTRTTILQLLCNVAEKQFTVEDSRSLLMSCIGSPDIRFSEDLLLVIRSISLFVNTPFKQTDNREFLTLHFLLSCNDEKIAILIIDTLFSLHKAQLISAINVFGHVEILMMKIRKVFFTATFVSSLISLSFKHPEALPIPCFIAATTGGEILCILLSELLPSPLFVINRLWFLWPLIVAIKFKEATESLIDFIIKSAQKDWLNIYATIEVVSRCLNDDPIPIQRVYLAHLGKCFLNGSISDHLSKYMKLCELFILTKPKERISKALHVAYAISPFIEGNELEIVSYDSYGMMPTIQTYIQFFETNDFFTNKMLKLAKANLTPQDIKFALDLNESGQWLDKELVNIVIRVYQKSQKDKNSNKIVKKYSDFVTNLKKPNCMELYEVYENMSNLITKTTSITPQVATQIVNNRLISMEFDKLISPKLEHFYNSCFTYISDENRRMKVSKDKSAKMWINLFRQLTLDRAPWRKLLPQSSSHFKRNNRLLACFCPVKLKRNMDFNEHKDASLKRDFGSEKTALHHFEEYQNALEAKYRNELPPQLLKLNDLDQITAAFVEEETNNSINSINNNNVNINNNNTNNINSIDLFAGMNSDEGPISSVGIMTKEKSQQYKASLITLFGPKDVTFSLMRKKCQIISEKENKVKTIEASSVTHILFRSYMHHERGFEIVTNLGKSYFINLLQAASLDLLKIISKLPAWSNALIQSVPHKAFVQSINIQSKWCNGLTSNFEYLMQLNFFGGRSFNETALYPVFPWILSNYTSTKIDLSDPKNFRILGSPMGAQTKQRLDELKSHMKDYMAIRNVGFLYNSCYISPLCVFLWLIRIEPFTTLHIQLQSGKFDHAARVFSSIPSAFRMTSTHMNDYRELIPEFFFTSSFIENRNKFDFGKVNKRVVDNAVLPKWSSSAIDFVYTHRKALESDYVSDNLNKWIDLIFGYKQRGPEAVKSNNTFDPCLYENVWTEENLNDPAQRSMIEALLQHCGHIPNQLFTSPHPRKKRFVMKPMISNSNSFQTGVVGSVFTVLYDYSKTSVRCLFCADDGKISVATTRIDPKMNQISCTLSPDNYEIDLSLTSIGKMVTIVFDSKLMRMICTTDTGALKVADVIQGRDTALFQHIGRVNCVAVSDNYIVSGGADTTVNIWDNNNGQNLSKIMHLKSIQSFRSEITCIDICEKFGTIASGTKDGSILLIDTASLITTNVIDIAPEIPVMVKIVTGWGFVIVYSTKAVEGRIVPFITLFDIDGQFIRKKQLSFPISCWTHYLTIDGFDYMVIANDMGNMYLFECYYLDIEDAGVPKNSSRIIALKYSYGKGLLFAARENGTLCAYSSNNLNTKRFERTVFGKNV